MRKEYSDSSGRCWAPSFAICIFSTKPLNEEGKEFASRWRLGSLIKKYSDHIDSPIFLTYEDTEYDKDGKEKSKGLKTEQINDAKAF